MSEQAFRSVRVALISLVALSAACAGESNRTTNTADTPTATPASNSSMPAEGMTPASGDQAPGPSPEASSTSGTGTSMTGSATTGTASGSTQAAGSTAPATPLSAAQIAMITELANTAEIEQGKLAQGKAKSPEVKKFAAMMVKHHTESKNEQAKLYKQLSLTPTQSQQATSLKEDADRATTSLRTAESSAFDVQYINGQVEAHEKVLRTINQDLLPAASDPKLVEALNKMKATVEAHLKEARALQANLAKTTPAAPAVSPPPQ